MNSIINIPAPTADMNNQLNANMRNAATTQNFYCCFPSPLAGESETLDLAKIKTYKLTIRDQKSIKCLTSVLLLVYFGINLTDLLLSYFSILEGNATYKTILNICTMLLFFLSAKIPDLVTIYKKSKGIGVEKACKMLQDQVDEYKNCGLFTFDGTNKIIDCPALSTPNLEKQREFYDFLKRLYNVLKISEEFLKIPEFSEADLLKWLNDGEEDCAKKNLERMQNSQQASLNLPLPATEDANDTYILRKVTRQTLYLSARAPSDHSSDLRGQGITFFDSDQMEAFARTLTETYPDRCDAAYQCCLNHVMEGVPLMKMVNRIKETLAALNDPDQAKQRKLTKDSPAILQRKSDISPNDPSNTTGVSSPENSKSTEVIIQSIDWTYSTLHKYALKYRSELSSALNPNENNIPSYKKENEVRQKILRASISQPGGTAKNSIASYRNESFNSQSGTNSRNNSLSSEDFISHTTDEIDLRKKTVANIVKKTVKETNNMENLTNLSAMEQLDQILENDRDSLNSNEPPPSTPSNKNTKAHQLPSNKNDAKTFRKTPQRPTVTLDTKGNNSTAFFVSPIHHSAPKNIEQLPQIEEGSGKDLSSGTDSEKLTNGSANDRKNSISSSLYDFRKGNRRSSSTSLERRNSAIGTYSSPNNDTRSLSKINNILPREKSSFGPNVYRNALTENNISNRNAEQIINEPLTQENYFYRRNVTTDNINLPSYYPTNPFYNPEILKANPSRSQSQSPTNRNQNIFTIQSTVPAAPSAQINKGMATNNLPRIRPGSPLDKQNRVSNNHISHSPTNSRVLDPNRPRSLSSQRTNQSIAIQISSNVTTPTLQESEKTSEKIQKSTNPFDDPRNFA